MKFKSHQMSVDYREAAAPPDYRCGTCRAAGCKLWRLYNTFLDHNCLACCDCAAKECEDDVSAIDAGGKHAWEGMVTDTIGGGSYVPAVPTEDGETFWGYTSVPEPGVLWWKRLPTRGPGAGS